MRVALLLAALLLLPASTCEEGSDLPVDRQVTIRGRLTDESDDCPTLRDRNNRLFSLAGSIEQYKIGDRVCVKGRILEDSACPRGITISVEWIGYSRFCP